MNGVVQSAALSERHGALLAVAELTFDVTAGTFSDYLAVSTFDAQDDHVENRGRRCENQSRDRDPASLVNHLSKVLATIAWSTSDLSVPSGAVEVCTSIQLHRPRSNVKTTATLAP